jgi:hypothetical protein
MSAAVQGTLLHAFFCARGRASRLVSPHKKRASIDGIATQ